MKTASIILLALGCVFLAVAGINAPKAPNISYLMGSFLPGLPCLIVRLKLGQTKRPAGRQKGNQKNIEEEV
jgi:hypothetical protein